MGVETLVELYQQKFPNSQLTRETITKHIAQLIEDSYSVELIFFSINYCSKYHSSELGEDPYLTIIKYMPEILLHFEIAKAKRALWAFEESEREYDPKNERKGAHTPSWFRASFDKHMFK